LPALYHRTLLLYCALNEMATCVQSVFTCFLSKYGDNVDINGVRYVCNPVVMNTSNSSCSIVFGTVASIPNINNVSMKTDDIHDEIKSRLNSGNA